MTKKRLTALQDRLRRREGRREASRVAPALLHGYADAEWTDRDVRRYMRDAGDELERLHILTRADCDPQQRKAARLRQAYEQLGGASTNREGRRADAMDPDLDARIAERSASSPARRWKPAGSC